MARSGQIGVGPTDDLTLRVSAAVLARVVFDHPEEPTKMLALEHKAYVSRTGRSPGAVVKAQPFGGAARILDADRFSTVVGGFNYDSERSRAEQDFRIFIRPSRLEALFEYAARPAGHAVLGDLETSPSRELEEEFEDTLDIRLKPEEYAVRPLRIVLQSSPSPTNNLRALGAPTVRVYWAYEVEIQDPQLCRLMLDNSRAHSGSVLGQVAVDRQRSGAKGRANAVLAVSLNEILQVYRATPVEKRGKPLPFQDTVLAGNVSVILEGLSVAGFRSISWPSP